MTYGNLKTTEINFIGDTFIKCSFPEFMMKMHLNWISNEDIKRLFNQEDFKTILVEFIVKFSFIEDYEMKKILNERMFNRMIDNMEGLFKNDYISEKDYSLIMNEIAKEINEIEEKSK